ncbi:YesL family protein [Thalassobacillus pellis]|uniref:YesL family protein n=1 Tax=Thalassobacillus pellis TaxID=748008 RepID=UPI001961EAF4|nr:YesL family protein [Thalassobacillus pellis]MBM7551560.1 putative membrane protein YesL [Thalassobacillus pellis]
MKPDGTMGKIYQIADWITKLAYVNVLWLLFSLLGLIVFGVAPASVALFTVIRKWRLKDTDASIFSTFAATFRKEYLRANKLGFVIGVAGLVLFVDYKYVAGLEGVAYFGSMVMLMIVTVIYLITVMYVLPVYVHFELKFFQYFKHAFVIGVANPLVTASMGAGALVLYFVMIRFQGLIPFFGISLLGYLFMNGSMRSFRLILAKQKKLATQVKEDAQPAGAKEKGDQTKKQLLPSQ